jgi:hypothetical protein
MHGLYARATLKTEDVAQAAVKSLTAAIFRDPEEARDPEARKMFTWPDGFYVINLLPSELPLEGSIQGMCVGRPEFGYARAVRAGDLQIHSLRRASGKPLFTFEVKLNEFDNPSEIAQIKGKANRLPGFDLGKTRIEDMRSIKRDEVERALAYVARLGLTIDRVVEDLNPAILALNHLARNGDAWGRKMINTYKIPAWMPGRIEIGMIIQGLRWIAAIVDGDDLPRQINRFIAHVDRAGFVPEENHSFVGSARVPPPRERGVAKPYFSGPCVTPDGVTVRPGEKLGIVVTVNRDEVLEAIVDIVGEEITFDVDNGPVSQQLADFFGPFDEDKKENPATRRRAGR